jgi:peptide/nickel transport system substrate-binding protein
MDTIHPSRKVRGQWFGKLIHRIESKPMSDRLLLRGLFFAIVASTIYALLTVNAGYLATTPVSGGTYVEGIVGIPRFVNPVLAVTRADQDMSALLYRGLMKINTEGILVPDLAESVTVSDDGRTYNVIMRRNLRFDDNTPLTARDVAFTIGLIQNADLKSPLRGNWSGVTVEEISEYELNIVLDEAYTPFIENFTIGIIPRHIWSELPVEQIPFSQRNTEPVGSGAFKVDRVIRNEAGLIERYELERASEEVRLDAMTVRFFQNEQDLKTAFLLGDITGTANLPPEVLAEVTSNPNVRTLSTPLPRVFGIFFNQNKSVILRDAAVREALELAIDRNAILDGALRGHGVPTALPIPPKTAVDSTNEVATVESNIEAAKTRLTKAGWQMNDNGVWEKRIDGSMVTLGFTIRTTNTPLFEETTRLVADAWRAIGVQVDVEQYEQSDLLQAVIRPRDFDALLFGLDMNRTVDLYPFWHSSQREDPGLNIAQYANLEVDKLLTDIRTTRDESERKIKETGVVNIIKNERPAIFLYAPNLTYTVYGDVTVSPLTGVSRPYERFMNVNEWHVEREERWAWFR